jgi:hypothetical protein
MQREQERTARVTGFLDELDGLVARMTEEEGEEALKQLQIAAYEPTTYLVSEVDLAGLELWNDKGLAGTIGGGIVVKGWLVIWFSSGEEPETNIVETMAHSWLQKPDTGIECDDGTGSVVLHARSPALGAGDERPPGLAGPAGDIGKGRLDAGFLFRIRVRQPATPSRPAGHAAALAAELTEGPSHGWCGS